MLSNKKKILSILISLIMLISTFPLTAMAEGEAALGEEWCCPSCVVDYVNGIRIANFSDFTQPDDLTRQSLIPDLLTFWDGRPVETPQEWEARRIEIRRMLEFYMYGIVPICPKQYHSHTVGGTGQPGGGPNTINVSVSGGNLNREAPISIGNITITYPPAAMSHLMPEEGWPIIFGALDAAFWQNMGYATAGVLTGRAAHDALWGTRINTQWDRNLGAYGIAAYNTEMAILGLRAEFYGENRLNINPYRVVVSGASTAGKRAACMGAMAESVWMSYPGAGGTGAANMYRQISGGSVWNMFSGPSTLEGSPGTFALPGGMWGPIGLAESWGGHAGWDGNYGGHYRNIPDLNADFAPVDIHFVAAMFARADGGKFFMPATGIAMESTNGVPGIQQMIDHALPAFELAGVPNNLGARVTRQAHGVDREASIVIKATLDWVEGRIAAENRHELHDYGYINLAPYFTPPGGGGVSSAAVVNYLNSLNFNVWHMHQTPFASPENAEMYARIQPCCNGDGDGSDCEEWCPHTADGLCCDPGVPPIDPYAEVNCVVIDFTSPERMGAPRQSLGWNQGANVGVVNDAGFLERRFTNHGGGIIFSLPLGDAKLGNFDMFEVALRVTAQSGANQDGPVGVVISQDRPLAWYPTSGNWWDGGSEAVRMERAFAGAGVIGVYTFDLTSPFNDENGRALPRDRRGITNMARWATGDISIAVGRNVHTSTMEFQYLRLRAMGCGSDWVCSECHSECTWVEEGIVIDPTCTKYGFTRFDCKHELCPKYETRYYVEPNFDSMANALYALIPEIIENGLNNSQLVFSGNNNATLTLVIGDIRIVLSENANNRNISGRVYFDDCCCVLIFDIRGNGSNIRMFTIIRC